MGSNRRSQIIYCVKIIFGGSEITLIQWSSRAVEKAIAQGVMGKSIWINLLAGQWRCTGEHTGYPKVILTISDKTARSRKSLYVWTSIYVPVHMETRANFRCYSSGTFTLGFLSFFSFFFILERVFSVGLSLAWILPSSLGWLPSGGPKVCLSPSPVLESQVHANTLDSFMSVLGLDLRTACSPGKHLPVVIFFFGPPAHK